MTMKNLDSQKRWRNKAVSFRMSPEEHQIFEAKVKMTGLSKQEYIIHKLNENDVLVKGNPKVYRALKYQMRDIIQELQRIKSGGNISEDLMEIMEFMTTVMDGLKVEHESEDR